MRYADVALILSAIFYKRGEKVNNHMITGATGFVGGALVLELLQRTEDLIFCLVRPADQDPQQRLIRALEVAADAYAAAPEVRAAIHTRVRAVPGDVEQPMCGVDADSLDFSCDTFWHSAASLRFEDRHAEQIWRSNVDGTRHALALAAKLGVRQFNSFSTAYVAGNYSGSVPEARLENVQSNNRYEASKIEAERLVLAASEFAVRIFRPSIVIGHSQTLGATNYTGMYGLLRQLYAFQGMMARTEENLLQQHTMTLRVDMDIPVDLVPVDRVVANAVTIHLATQATLEPGQARFYHLNNPIPPSIDQLLNLMFRMVGIAPPRFATSDEEMKNLSWLDDKFNERIEFYNSYFRNHKVFERGQTARWVGAEDPSHYHMPDAVLERHCRWYLDQLVAERANLPQTR
jgi:nucleoside-diphosphate-sugar epimerase